MSYAYNSGPAGKPGHLPVCEGAVRDDRLRAASLMVRIEGMSSCFRAAQLTTTILGKDSPRRAVAMNTACGAQARGAALA